MRAVVLSFTLAGLGMAQAPVPSPEAKPAFEVATVKPSDPAQSQGWWIHGRQVEIHKQTVVSLMMFAYGIHPKQVAEGPAWMEQERWDIRGVAEMAAEPSHEQLQLMLQGLLAERFGLRFRREGREMAAYVVTVAKGGSKLEPSKSAPAAQPDQDAGRDAHGAWLRMVNVSMPLFDLYLQYFLDRPVVDRTGLKGGYDVLLKWKPGISTAAGNGDDYPELLEASEEELGLKMAPGRDVVETFVVEQVQRPTAN